MDQSKTNINANKNIANDEISQPFDFLTYFSIQLCTDEISVEMTI